MNWGAPKSTYSSASYADGVVFPFPGGLLSEVDECFCVWPLTARSASFKTTISGLRYFICYHLLSFASYSQGLLSNGTTASP